MHLPQLGHLEQLDYATFLAAVAQLQAPEWLIEEFDATETQHLQWYGFKQDRLQAILLVDPAKKHIIYGVAAREPWIKINPLHQGRRPVRYPPQDVARQLRVLAEMKGWHVKPTLIGMGALAERGQCYGLLAQTECNGRIIDIKDIPEHVEGTLALEGIPNVDLSHVRQVDGNLFVDSLAHDHVENIVFTGRRSHVALGHLGLRYVANITCNDLSLSGNPDLKLGPGIKVRQLLALMWSLPPGAQLPADLEAGEIICEDHVSVPSRLEAVTRRTKNVEFIPEEEVRKIVDEERRRSNQPDIGLD